MIEKLNIIKETTSNEAIIIGGYSRWLNGYTEQPSSIWIDISIPQSQVENVKSLGKYLPLPQTDEQFVVKADGYVLDVFIQDTSNIDYTIISDLKVLTAQADLDYHMATSASVLNDYMHEKTTEIKELYS